MSVVDDWDEEEEEEIHECEECGAEDAQPYSYADGEVVVWLCDACANPTCYVCGEKIEGVPISGWDDLVGSMVKLCEACAEKNPQLLM